MEEVCACGEGDGVWGAGDEPGGEVGDVFERFGDCACGAVGEGEDEGFDCCDGHGEIWVGGEELSVGGYDVEVAIFVRGGGGGEFGGVDGHFGGGEVCEKAGEEIGRRFEVRLVLLHDLVLLLLR